MAYKMVRLDELGKVITGNTPSKKKNEYYNEAIVPFIKPNNFNTVSISSLSEADEYLSYSGAKVARLVENGAVLVTCIGTIGSVGIADKEICFNQQINAIVPNERIVNNRYLAYAIIKRKEQLKAIANAPVVPIINKTQFSAFEIPLPPLETQNKIVEVLDKAQELIDARKEQIRLIDELIQAQFIEMFGNPVTNPKNWEVSKMKNHVNNIESGWSPKCLNSEAPINKWGVLKLSAVTGGQYKEERNKKLPEDVSPRLGLEIKDGDLLLTRKNTPELVGDSCFVFKTRKKLMMPDIIFRIQTKKTLNRLFLWSVFNTNEMKSRIKSLASGSAKSMSNISKAKLYDLEVIVPNIDLQNDFEIRVRKIVSYKELLLKSLYELETYNKALFKESFINDFLEVHR